MDYFSKWHQPLLLKSFYSMKNGNKPSFQCWRVFQRNHCLTNAHNCCRDLRSSHPDSCHAPLTLCSSYFCVACLFLCSFKLSEKHHETLRKKSFIVLEKTPSLCGEAWQWAGMMVELRARAPILSQKQEADRDYTGTGFKSQSPLPVTHFLQQGRTPPKPHSNITIN